MERTDRDFRSWDITPEQADRIKAGDTDAGNVFIVRHIKRLQTMALNYAMKHNRVLGRTVYEVPEMIAQLFCDLSELNWRNAYTLTLSIKNISFAWSAFGGYAQRKAQGLIHTRNPWDKVLNPARSLDELVKVKEGDNEELRLLDCIPDEDTPETLFEKNNRKEYEPGELADILRDILSPREDEYLRLFLAGVPYSKICEKMGVDASLIHKKLRRKLVIRYGEVVSRLTAAGVDIPDRYNRTPPDYAQMCAEAEKIRAKKRVKDEERQRPFTRHATDEERATAQKASARAWYERNKEKMNEARRKRRASERAARAGGNA